MIKYIQIICLSIVMFFTAIQVQASTIDPTKNTGKLEVQVTALISGSSIWSAQDAGEKINVEFMVSSQGQIIVLSTSSQKYDKEIKNLLNYKEVTIDQSMHNQLFILPVKLTVK